MLDHGAFFLPQKLDVRVQSYQTLQKTTMSYAQSTHRLVAKSTIFLFHRMDGERFPIL